MARKSLKIPRARYGPLVWRDGKCIDADDARDFAEAVHEYFVRTHIAPSLTALHLFPLEEYTLLAELPPQLAERAALRSRLSYCACGGRAIDHRQDRDGNLFECSHCDNCRQFKYPEAA
jgi:hypothetical protein